MTKKYNLILSKGFGADTVIGYARRDSEFVEIMGMLTPQDLDEPYTQFTQEEIDQIKDDLPTKGMKDVVDVSKVEVKVPLYYMQSKKKDKDGMRLFFVFEGDESLESTDGWRQTSIKNLLDKYYIAHNSLLRPKSDWEPYLTPDREVIRYNRYLDY